MARDRSKHEISGNPYLHLFVSHYHYPHITILGYFFVDIQQKRDNVESKDKRAMMRLILAISIAVVAFSFYVDVIFCVPSGIAP